MPTAEAIPMTAWEQIAVVCLFGVIFGGLIVYLMNWFSKQQIMWQKFMDKINEDNRKWIENMECNTRKSMGQVTEALEAVNDNLREIANELKNHDNKVDEKFDGAVKEIQKFNGTDRRKAVR